MSELTEIAAILFRNLSDAFLTTANQLSSSKPFTQAKPKPEVVENPDFASLEIGDFIYFSTIHRNQPKRCAGIITDISGEEITVTNDVLNKTWKTTPDQVVYKLLHAYEIE
jgi:hypothetical protein